MAPLRRAVVLATATLALGCGSSNAGAPRDGGAAGATAGSGGATGGAGAAGAAGSGAAASSADAGGPVDAGPSSKRQMTRPVGTNGAPNGYLEYLPPGYDAQTPMPLLVFWHGLGEDGNGASDLMKLTAWGPPKLIANDKWDAARPFIVLSAQYNPTSGAIAPGGGCPSAATIDTFLTWAVAHYPVDLKRVYLTGLSCGAIGSWDYLAAHQGAVIAAAVLLSGNPGDPTQAGSAWKRAGCLLGTAAIWSLHGDADDTVPYAPDHDTVQDLIACPAPPRRAAKFTDIVGGGHTIWDPIYDLSGGSGDIYAWMLANAKP
jgi:poly(3-hydroxybutyrate) depolymerase